LREEVLEQQGGVIHLDYISPAKGGNSFPTSEGRPSILENIIHNLLKMDDRGGKSARKLCLFHLTQKERKKAVEKLLLMEVELGSVMLLLRVFPFLY